MRRLLLTVFAVLLFTVAGWSQSSQPAHHAVRAHRAAHVKRAAYARKKGPTKYKHHYRANRRRRHARRHGA